MMDSPTVPSAQHLATPPTHLPPHLTVPPVHIPPRNLVRRSPITSVTPRQNATRFL